MLELKISGLQDKLLYIYIYGINIQLRLESVVYIPPSSTYGVVDIGLLVETNLLYLGYVKLCKLAIY